MFHNMFFFSLFFSPTLSHLRFRCYFILFLFRFSCFFSKFLGHLSFAFFLCVKQHFEINKFINFVWIYFRSLTVRSGIQDLFVRPPTPGREFMDTNRLSLQPSKCCSAKRSLSLFDSEWRNINFVVYLTGSRWRAMIWDPRESSCNKRNEI